MGEVQAPVFHSLVNEALTPVLIRETTRGLDGHLAVSVLPSNPEPLMAFMNFWKTINSILRSRGQDELLYGDARAWWAEYLANS
jgi:hypothetical protein